MSLNLPPDPYKALGVTKDAKLAEIRSAHRKLVLKCHPDKVQDAALKAIKQDEFQQVQQAYELLSDDVRRIQYDEQVKLFELRREMGRGGNPTSRANPFDFEIRTAEPRSNSYSRSSSKAAPPPPKVYTQQPPPRSYEDVIYDEPLKTAKKSASYESSDRRRPTTRDGTRDSDRRRHEDEEILRQKWEKENKRAAHGDKKKSRDKEKRRGAEEKHSRSQPYVEDDEDDYRPPPREKKSSRHRMEEEIRIRSEETAAKEAANARAAKESSRQAPLTPKWDNHKDYAAQYQAAARRKAAPVEEFHPGPPRRAETFAGEPQRYDVHYTSLKSPHLSHSPSDDDSPRRSSARTTRRASEAPSSTRRDTPVKEYKRSPSAQAQKPYIVEPPSPTIPITKVPQLQSHSSAPPLIPSTSYRRKLGRSQTQDYPSQDTMPPLPRAHTFQSGDNSRDRDRERDRDRDRGSRLKKSHNYTSSDSDSELAPTQAYRTSHSPSRRPSPPSRTSTSKYIIDNGRSVPVPPSSHHIREGERSSSRHRDERPPIARSGGTSGSRQAPQRSHSTQAYSGYPQPPDPPPVILTARPKMPPRESGSGRESGRGSSGTRGGVGQPYFGEVKYSPNYGENVVYAPVPGQGGGVDMYGRRGSEGHSGGHGGYGGSYGRGGRGELYT